jgi:hypothetical protein
VGKLRAAGNSLCAPVAQAFIETMMDITGLTHYDDYPASTYEAGEALAGGEQPDGDDTDRA